MPLKKTLVRTGIAAIVLAGAGILFLCLVFGTIARFPQWEYWITPSLRTWIDSNLMCMFLAVAIGTNIAIIAIGVKLIITGRSLPQ